MFRTCNGRTRGRALGLSTTLLTAAGLIWVGSHEPAAAQAYNGGPNQVIVNMDVLNGLPGAYGAGYGAPAQPYGQAPKSQFLPGTAPQGYAATPTQLGSPPLGAPRYLPPYTPYGVAGAGAQPLPLAPGLAGLATPPSSTPSSVLTTLGPDGRPIQPIKLKQPGSTKQASKPKKKEYAAPAQPAPTETASAPEPAPEPASSDEQVAAIEPPTPPAEPEAVPDTVPMPEATPAPDAVVETAPAVEAPEPPAETPAEPVEEQVATPEAPAPEEPAEEAPAEAVASEAAVPEAPAAEIPPAETATEEATGEETTETAAVAAPAPDNSAPAAPIPQGGIRIVFPTEMNDVPTEANAALDDLAGQMLADEDMRIQIMCYASGTEETESKARRKSLARCINIRQYLFKKDVRTTRMDVRALGLKSEGQPADRVDIVPASS